MKNKAGEEFLRSACGTKLEAIGYVRITAEGELSTGLYKWANEDNAVAVLGIQSKMNKACKKAKEELSTVLSQVVATNKVKTPSQMPQLSAPEYGRWLYDVCGQCIYLGLCNA